ncbi:hypothetical protein DPMN_011493 [Dreissena polymorpha]|uniref:Uncharacterized protein n=1 Tax=Dreissena polymorpha TaxID=45954 RepID=A0A9D4S0B0_DREPO|nr:hypothetical protein DPMN_011493 [Dreissena polymorpha]
MAKAAIAILSRFLTSSSPPRTGSSCPTLSPSYSTAARPGRFTRTQNARYRHLNIDVSKDCSASPIYRYRAQNQRVRAEHDCNTCWSTRTLLSNDKSYLC